MRYAELYARSRTQIGRNDLWIGAAAVARGLPLLTRNVAELSRIEGLRTTDYASQRRSVR